MALKLNYTVDRVDNGIDRKTFQEKYMRPQRPVIVKHFYGADSPIYSKWTFDYFHKELGDIEVGVQDPEGETRKDDRSYKGAALKMKFSEYLDTVQAKPTSMRLFLFNVFKHRKELLDDFSFPDVADNVLKFLPFAFFGGQGAITRIHRDMDNSNVFLTELAGRKRVVLFSPEYSKLLYQYPFGTHTSIDVNNPDYDQYPALAHVQGYECWLEPGDTLFMPSGWWHHIEYHSPGLGFAMRSLSPNLKDRLKGFYQVGVMTHVDEALRFLLGDQWFKLKKQMANQRAAQAIKKSQPSLG